MMKMISAKNFRIISVLLIFALALIVTSFSASAKTTKIFKAVAAENEERTVNSDSSGADAEAEVTASPEPKKNNKSDKPKHSSKKKQQLKKSDADSNNVDSQILEEADKAVIDENQENVYEVLTDIRCILLGLMMCIGLLVGMDIAQSFERGIKK